MEDGARVGEERLHFPLAGRLAHILVALADSQTEIRDALRHSSSPRSRSRGLRVESAPPSRLGSDWVGRSEEHTSELQSLMRISYAVYCLKKKKITQQLTMKLHTIATNTTSKPH